jgi:zinc/manganese transport system substrate-binding protein
LIIVIIAAVLADRSPSRPTLPVLGAVAVLGLGLAGCGDGGGGGNGGSGTEVVATTGILADLATEVAGPDARVTQLVPDNADPHSFSLSAEDRLELDQADLVAANGAGLEAGLPLDEGETVWELAANVEEVLPASDLEEGPDDPHVWMDATRVAGALPSLADALADADPANAEAYRQRADDFAERLTALDREIERVLRPIPPPDRELVTSHDALGYFADRYGFEVVATAFPTTGAEAEVSAERLADVEQAVRDSQVPAVFAQEGDDPEVLSLVADDTGVELNYGLLVESPAAAGSYEEMLRGDAELIARSLRG